MFENSLFFSNLQTRFYTFLDVYLWKIVESFSIIVSWAVLAFALYKLIKYIFERFHILEYIDKLEDKLGSGVVKDTSTQEKKELGIDAQEPLKITKKFKIDEIVAKSVSYYVFLLFFRLAISLYGINEVENFMDELIDYLPNLFIWAIIGYLWYRFSKFIHDIILYAFGVHSKETARIIATWAHGIVLFFIVMAVLDQVWIATNITNALLNGFIAMLALAGGLAFGLGGKDVAREILEWFKN